MSGYHCILLIDDAHNPPIAFRVRSVTRVGFLFRSSLVVRASPSLPDLALAETMHTSGDLTHASAHLIVFLPIKARLTSGFTDCNCALSVQGHRQFWPFHEHGRVDQPW